MRENIDKEYMAALEQANEEDDETEEAMENGTNKKKGKGGSDPDASKGECKAVAKLLTEIYNNLTLPAFQNANKSHSTRLVIIF